MTNQKSEKTTNNGKPLKTMSDCVTEQLANMEAESAPQLDALVKECLADPKLFITHVILFVQQLEAQHHSLRAEFKQLIVPIQAMAAQLLKEKSDEGS